MAVLALRNLQKTLLQYLIIEKQRVFFLNILLSFAGMNTLKTNPFLFSLFIAAFLFSCNGGINTNQTNSADTPVRQNDTEVSNALWTALPLNAMKGMDTTQNRFNKYKLFSLDSIQMQALLQKSPKENSRAKNANENLIELPRPDSGFMTFRVYTTNTMDSVLEARYPSLKTYGGQGIEDRTAMVRLDFNPNGFHAYVISQAGEWIIQPAGKGITHQYLTCFFKQDVEIPNRGPFEIPGSGKK